MELLKEYLKCLAAGNAEGVSKLFAEDGIFYDEGPVKANMGPVTITGKEGIRAFFQQVFSTQGPIKSFNVGINGNAMRYDVTVGNIEVQALGLLTEKEGLIAEYRVVVL